MPDFSKTRFLHTADWQIGKPFQSITTHAQREALRSRRIETVRGLRALIEQHQLQFVVVCGDLFDSSTPDQSTVSALCSAVGALQVPVYAIPGNHDHAGPGCIWKQEFFLREQQQLAPNLHLLLKPEPTTTESAILLPCPLLRRHENVDPTAWLRNFDLSTLPTDRPRIVLAHGSTQGFSSAEEEDRDHAANSIDLDRLPQKGIDYIALGDWHGAKSIGERAWYSGTSEQDRFAKGEGNRPGHVLKVEVEPGRPPAVELMATGFIQWHQPPPFDLNGDDALEHLKHSMDSLLGRRTGSDLLKLELTGSLSLEGSVRLEGLIESLRARLLDLRLHREIVVEPSPEELAELTGRDDPLISTVARELHQESASPDPEEAALAKAALRELHLQLRSP